MLHPILRTLWARLAAAVCCVVVAVAIVPTSRGSAAHAAAANSTNNPAASLTVLPSRIDLHEPRAEHGLLVSFTGPDGRVIDVTGNCRITSSNTAILSITP